MRRSLTPRVSPAVAAKDEALKVHFPRTLGAVLEAYAAQPEVCHHTIKAIHNLLVVGGACVVSRIRASPVSWQWPAARAILFAADGAGAAQRDVTARRSWVLSAPTASSLTCCAW